MEFKVNGERVDFSAGDDESLGVVLNKMEAVFVEPGYVVKAINIDGEQLTAERLSIWKEFSLKQFNEIEMIVKLRSELAADGLKGAIKQLAESDKLRCEVVDLAGSGKMQEAVLKLQDYLHVWDNTQRILGSACRTMQVDMNELEVFDNGAGSGELQRISVTELINKLSSQLSQVQQALEAGDMVMLGDIVDYEFGDLADAWGKMLKQLAEQFAPGY